MRNENKTKFEIRLKAAEEVFLKISYHRKRELSDKELVVAKESNKRPIQKTLSKTSH